MKKYMAPLIFIFAMLLFFPMNYIRLFDAEKVILDWFSWQIFDWNYLGALALGLILCSPERLLGWFNKYPETRWAAGIWLLWLILQQIFVAASIINFCGGLSYLTVPLFIGLYRREFQRIFPYLMTFFLLLSIIGITRDIIVKGTWRGICGNWNWSASLLTLSLPAVLFWWKPKKYVWYFSGLILISLIISYELFEFPKGTILGICAVGFIFLFIKLYRYFSRRTLLLILGGLVLIGSAAAWVLINKITLIIADDVRFFLWDNGIKVWLENPVFGCEMNRYCSESSPLMAPEYYLMDTAAEQNTNPHNEILFMLATFGIMGLGLIYFWGKRIYLNVKKCFTMINFENSYFLFAVILLSVHAMVDIPLAIWPLNFIFFLLLILWCFEDTTPQKISLKIRLGFIVSGLLLLLWLSFAVYNFSAATWFYRKSLSKNEVAELIKTLETSRSFQKLPAVEYDLAVVYYRKGELDKAQEIFENFRSDFGIDHYIHNHVMLANIYMSKRLPHLALPQYELEYKNYPLSVINLFFYRQALMDIKKFPEAQAVNVELQKTLKLKNLTEKNIPALLNEPQYDLKYRHCPK